MELTELQKQVLTLTEQLSTVKNENEKLKTLNNTLTIEKADLQKTNHSLFLKVTAPATEEQAEPLKETTETVIENLLKGNN